MQHNFELLSLEELNTELEKRIELQKKATSDFIYWALGNSINNIKEIIRNKEGD